MFLGVSFEFEPVDEFGVENVVFFEVVAVLVFDYFVFGGVFIVGVDFFAAFVADEEDGFDAGGSLGADAHGAGGGDGEQGDVGADHDHVPVGEVQQAYDAVHHAVAQGHQGVDAAQLQTVDALG